MIPALAALSLFAFFFFFVGRQSGKQKIRQEACDRGFGAYEFDGECFEFHWNKDKIDREYRSYHFDGERFVKDKP